jgi:hypothetical protein
MDQITETVRAQTNQAHRIRQLVTHQLPGDQGKQRLSPIAW